MRRRIGTFTTGAPSIDMLCLASGRCASQPGGAWRCWRAASAGAGTAALAQQRPGACAAPSCSTRLGDVPHATLAYERGFELLGVRRLRFQRRLVAAGDGQRAPHRAPHATGRPGAELRDGFAHLLCRSLSFASKLMMFTTTPTQPMLRRPAPLGRRGGTALARATEIAASFAGAAYTAALLGPCAPRRVGSAAACCRSARRRRRIG